MYLQIEIISIICFTLYVYIIEGMSVRISLIYSEQDMDIYRTCLV